MPLGLLKAVFPIFGGIVTLIALTGYLSGGFAKLRAFVRRQRQARVAKQQRIATIEANNTALTARVAELEEQVLGEVEGRTAIQQELATLKEMVANQAALHNETRDQVADLRRVDADFTQNMQALDDKVSALDDGLGDLAERVGAIEEGLAETEQFDAIHKLSRELRYGSTSEVPASPLDPTPADMWQQTDDSAAGWIPTRPHAWRAASPFIDEPPPRRS